MKVLGLIGSPRVGGNTEKLVNAILEGAAEKGAEIKTYHLAGMHLLPCKGCLSCKIKGKCIIDDDMQELYEEIRSVDALIIGSPIYMWEVTTLTKMVIDRLIALTCWQPYAKPEFPNLLRANTKLVLAYTYGNPDPNNFNQYFKYMEGLFSFLGFNVQESIWVSGTIGPDDILNQSEIFEEARARGKKL